jgi:response regulator RpfG family c-di-GMP phosphodiesterase
VTSTTAAQTEIKQRVLIVDDEETVLMAVARLLRPDGVQVLTAANGDEALAVLEEHAPSIGAVISDYAMPGMSGADLLRAVRLRWPELTRVLLTGNADLPAAAEAVNEGQLSRLITKPWTATALREVVGQALEQNRLQAENRRLRQPAEEQAEHLAQWSKHLEELVAQRTAELEQANASLQRGLLDTVRLLLTLLERRQPERAARCREVARLARRLADRMEVPPAEVQQIQVAALIHDVGLTGLPDHLVKGSPDDLPRAGQLLYRQHPVLGESLLGTVEQLGPMRAWIRHHHERWDGRGYPDRLAGLAIPLPSRIIAVADAYLEAVSREGGTAAAWRRRERTAGVLDPDLLAVLSQEVAPYEQVIPFAELQPGMSLAKPIRLRSGGILVPAGERITPEQVARVRTLAEQGHLDDDGAAPADLASSIN